MPEAVTSGPFGTNAYVVPDGAGGCLVVDPGLDEAALTGTLERLGLAPSAVLCTHGHFDHIAGAALLQRRHRIPVYLHRADERIARGANFLLMAFKLPQRVTLPEFTWLSGDEVVHHGTLTARVLHAPGHTPGSCVITLEETHFTGDTLYAGGVGLMRLPGEDLEVLTGTLHRLWSLIEEEALVCPGHGPSAPMREIRVRNLALRELLGHASDQGGRAVSAAPRRRR